MCKKRSAFRISIELNTQHKGLHMPYHQILKETFWLRRLHINPTCYMGSLAHQSIVKRVYHPTVSR
jgi:hypothetical protein